MANLQDLQNAVIKGKRDEVISFVKGKVLV